MKFIPWIIFTFLFTSFAGAASGASLIISSSGNGVFTLQGVGLADAWGIDATISYDTSTLTNPRVEQGSLIAGALMAANPNTPGIVRIAAVKSVSISGSGIVATISFDTAPENGGKILSLNAKVVNGSGARLNVATQVNNPATSTVSSDTTIDTQAIAGTSSSHSTAGQEQRYLGPTGINYPSGSEEYASRKAQADDHPEEPAPGTGETVPVETLERVKPEITKPAGAATVTSTECKPASYKSVLEAFREYTGTRTIKALRVLFDTASFPGIRQEPGVVLSDGKTIVKVLVQMPSTVKEPPNFVLVNAKLISLKPDRNSWAIEALPEKNVNDADISVMANGCITQIPLIIARPMDAGKYKEYGNANFSSSGRKAPKNPKCTKDTRYLDDYIFVANYIVKNKPNVK